MDLCAMKINPGQSNAQSHITYWTDGVDVQANEDNLEALTVGEQENWEIRPWKDARFAKEARNVTCSGVFDRGTKVLMIGGKKLMVVEEEIRVYEAFMEEEDEEDEDFSIVTELKREPDEIDVGNGAKRAKTDGKVGIGSFALAENGPHVLRDLPSDDLEYSFVDELNLKEPTISLADMLTCIMCRTVFPTALELENHCREYRINMSATKCCVEGCEEMLANSQLFSHMNEHCDNRVCKKCLRIVPNHTDVAQHCARSPTVCLKCGKKSLKLDKLLVHLLSATNCFQIVAGRICYWCGDEFDSHADLLAHEESRSSKNRFACCKCDFQAGKLNFGGLRDHMYLEHSSWEENCELCGLTFHVPSMLRLHLKNHGSCVCKYCGKGYRKSHDLRSHYTESLTNTCRDKYIADGHNLRTHDCKYCGKSFYSRDEFRKHVAKHENTGHACWMCPKTFPDSTDWKYHLYSHVGARPYACCGCGKHFRVPHNIRDERYHKCPLTLASVRDYKHRDCVVCKTEFRTRLKMFEHQTSRFDVKGGVYKCCKCGQGFEEAKVLSDHLDAHAGD